MYGSLTFRYSIKDSSLLTLGKLSQKIHAHRQSLKPFPKNQQKTQQTHICRPRSTNLQEQKEALIYCQGLGDEVGELTDDAHSSEKTPTSNRFHLQCGAGLIKKTLMKLDEAERVSFILLLWPNLGADLANLIAKYPDEVRVNGAQLVMPSSWKELARMSPSTARN